MNILLINHYAGGPAYGMEFRPHLLGREWVKLGHQVQVLGAGFAHVRSAQPLPLDADAPREERVDGVDFRWYPVPAYAGNGWDRLRNIAAFLTALWRDSSWLVSTRRPDVVIASSTYPMDVWVARRIARQAGARLVFELHDLWPASLVELAGMSPWHPFALLCGGAERTAYRSADVVVSMLPKVHAHLAACGLDLQRLHVVPNGISAADWAAAPLPLRADLAAALKAARASGESVVAYAGAMGAPNALDTLLDAAHRLRGERVCLLIVGDGHERERLQRRIADEGLARVQWFPPVPKAMMPALLAAIDISYIGWRRQPLYRFGISPNKLMDYMMAGRPVLHSVDAGNDPVGDAGCGLTVAPESPEAVADGMRWLLALPRAERDRMGRAGRSYVLAHHEWGMLARRFLMAIEASMALPRAPARTVA